MNDKQRNNVEIFDVMLGLITITLKTYTSQNGTVVLKHKRYINDA
jgi:hypothetical protein